MNTKKRVILSGMVIAAVLVLTGCNALEKNTRSASYLTIMSLQGTDTSGKSADYLQSDVVHTDGSIAADIAVATISNSTLDPNPIEGTSSYNNVVITRYVVHYSQPNGANVEGVDVPYAFEGNLSVTVPIDGTASFGFVVVREVAKVEPPLVQLAEVMDVLQCTATIDFYGHDMANKKVSVTGYLPVFFANYVDTAGPAAQAARRQR